MNAIDNSQLTFLVELEAPHGFQYRSTLLLENLEKETSNTETAN